VFGLRRYLAILVLGLVWLVASSDTAAAQHGSGIVAPTAGATLSGVVSVQGVADHPTFRKWQLDLLEGGDEKQVRFLAVGETPVIEPGELFRLDTKRYANGEHKLRLRVVYRGMNYDEHFTPIRIENLGALTLPAAAPSTPVTETVSAPVDAPLAVFRTDGPADGARRIEVDISDQTLTAYQGDVPVFHTTVSTGKPGWRTLPGTFRVYVKYEKARMTGEDYDTPDVPWTMYYSGDFAIHGAYWHNNFGTPVSHGCVNLRVPEAKSLFEWSSVGTEVVVRP
jgi:hypothetical protein